VLLICCCYCCCSDIRILSRQNKRFILNEHELAQHIESMGFKVLLLPLEDMTAYEQLRALRSINILVGIHGRYAYAFMQVAERLHSALTGWLARYYASAVA